MTGGNELALGHTVVVYYGVVLVCCITMDREHSSIRYLNITNG